MLIIFKVLKYHWIIKISLKLIYFRQFLIKETLFEELIGGWVYVLQSNRGAEYFRLYFHQFSLIFWFHRLGLVVFYSLERAIILVLGVFGTCIESKF